MNQNMLQLTDAAIETVPRKPGPVIDKRRSDCVVAAIGRLPKSAVDVTSLLFVGGKESPRPNLAGKQSFTHVARSAIPRKTLGLRFTQP